MWLHPVSLIVLTLPFPFHPVYAHSPGKCTENNAICPPLPPRPRHLHSLHCVLRGSVVCLQPPRWAEGCYLSSSQGASRGAQQGKYGDRQSCQAWRDGGERCRASEESFGSMERREGFRDCGTCPRVVAQGASSPSSVSLLTWPALTLLHNAQVYFILVLYSYAIHLRRNTFRPLLAAQQAAKAAALPASRRPSQAAHGNAYAYQHLRNTSTATNGGEAVWDLEDEEDHEQNGRRGSSRA